MLRRFFYAMSLMMLLAGIISCSQKREQVQQSKVLKGKSGSSYAQDNPDSTGAESQSGTTAGIKAASESDQVQITFIELGSVNCIPCKKMQPVMKSIEKKYAGQVNVVFHDVWTEEGKPFASYYGIRLIPTQIFVDAAGNEIMRHEGFFPEEEIEAFLQSHGVKVQ